MLGRILNNASTASGSAPQPVKSAHAGLAVALTRTSSTTSGVDRIRSTYPQSESPPETAPINKKIITGGAINGFLPSIFEASIPDAVAKLFGFWGLDSELRQLRKVLIKIKMVYRDGERLMYVNELVTMWMDDVKEAAYELDDIANEMNAKFLRQQDAKKSHILKSEIQSKLSALLVKLGELVGQACDYGLKQERGGRSMSQWSTRNQTSHSIDVSGVYGRVEDKNRLVACLLDQQLLSNKRNYSVIGIVGMGGIGKTTLAQLVFQDERVVEEFDLRCWACVSDVFDAKRVLTDLYTFSTGERSDDTSLTTLHRKIESLVRGKRFLFVLDDGWIERVGDWEKLRAPFGQCGMGSVVLVTTRNQNVLVTMGSREVHKLERLEDAHCWDLFKENAFRHGDVNSELEEVGMKIVEKCKGVPLAAKALGSNLCGIVDKVRWTNILAGNFWDLPIWRDEIFPALRVSYHCLPFHLKLCFEYLSLFPTNYMFKKDELVQLWIAEGFVKPQSGREIEDVGNEYYVELQERSLIGADHRMHDLIHSLACKVSTKFYSRKMDRTTSSNAVSRARHLSFYDVREGVKELALAAGSLHTFVLLGSVSFGKFDLKSTFEEISSWEHLRAIDLWACKMTEKFYSSVGNWTQLRFLRFQDHNLKALPISICNLHSLQTLILDTCSSLINLPNEMGNLISLRLLHLSYSKVSYLPNSIWNLPCLQAIKLNGCEEVIEISEEIGKLQSLRHLELSGSGILHLPNSICNMTSLETLDLNHCYSLLELPNGLTNLVNLRLLKAIYLSDLVHSSTPPYIGRLVHLESELSFPVGREEGGKITELQHLSNITGVYLYNLENVESVEEAKMAMLKNKKSLKYLSFQWGKRKKEEEEDEEEDGAMEWKVFEALQPHPTNIETLALKWYSGERLPNWMQKLHFSSLRILTMSGMNRLATVAGATLSSLKYLDIIDCPMLTEFQMVAPSLVRLKVENCPGMTCLSLSQPDYEKDQNSGLEVRTCINLEYLFMKGCHQFESFGEEELPKSLKEISVMDCASLKSLPSSMHELASLVDLCIEKCHQLESFAEVGLPKSLKQLKVIDCASLKSLPSSMHELASLVDLCIEKCHQLESFAEEGLPKSLKQLKVIDCASLKSLPSSMHSLDSLLYLCIEKCNQLESFAEEGLPISLKQLIVIDCESLRSFPLRVEELPQLEELEIQNCKNLKTTPKGLSTTNHPMRRMSSSVYPELKITSQDLLPPLVPRLRVDSGLD